MASNVGASAGVKKPRSARKNAEVPMFLDELRPGLLGPVIVMICRKWDVNSITGYYMSTDFIISDRKGNVMHATAKANIAHRFVDKLKEGGIYSLRGFTVQPNKEEYRIMKEALYMIELQGSTLLSKASEDVSLFNRYPFDLVPLEELKPTEQKYFLDVVGHVASVAEPVIQKNARQTVDCNLFNERGRHVRVTMWGKLGDELIELSKQQHGTIAVIMTSMSAKSYNSQICLSSSTSTIIIANDDVPQIMEFKAAFSTIGQPVGNAPIMQSHPPADTLATLLKWGRERKKEVSIFRGEVEITNIRTKNSWYNLTCTSGKCRKGVIRREKNHWCEACEMLIEFPRPRFRLQLDVEDESGSIVLVLFDETAEKLTNSTAKALLAQEDEDEEGEASLLPEVLSSLIDTKQTFEIKSNTYYQYGEYESFNCARVLTPSVATETLPGESNKELQLGPHGMASSSNTVSKAIGVKTPAKKSEKKKRKALIVESDSEDSENSIPVVDGDATALGKKRSKESPDSEPEECESVLETQQDDES